MSSSTPCGIIHVIPYVSPWILILINFTPTEQDIQCLNCRENSPGLLQFSRSPNWNLI